MSFQESPTCQLAKKILDANAAAGENDFDTVAHGKIGGYLKNPDIGSAARESDIRPRYRKPAREFIQARDERQPADISRAGIQKSTGGYRRSSRCVVVRYG